MAKKPRLPMEKVEEAAAAIHTLAQYSKIIDLLFAGIVQINFDRLMPSIDYLCENREFIIEVCTFYRMPASIAPDLTNQNSCESIRDCCLLLQKIAMLLSGGRVH
jgi:hypothetical protein